jgi:hypothetical protein
MMYGYTVENAATYPVSEKLEVSDVPEEEEVSDI